MRNQVTILLTCIAIIGLSTCTDADELTTSGDSIVKEQNFKTDFPPEDNEDQFEECDSEEFEDEIGDEEYAKYLEDLEDPYLLESADFLEKRTEF